MSSDSEGLEVIEHQIESDQLEAYPSDNEEVSTSSYDFSFVEFGSTSRYDSLEEQHNKSPGQINNPDTEVDSQPEAIMSSNIATTTYPRLFARAARARESQEPVADIDQSVAEGYAKVQALERVIRLREQNGQSVGRLPQIKEQLAQKIAELKLYNTSEEARWQHAWSMAREYDERMREKAIKNDEAPPLRAEVPLQYRSLREYWCKKKEAERNTPEAIKKREEEAAKRRKECAPIIASMERTLYQSAERRDEIGDWIVCLPEDFPETGGPAPAPTYG